jgi:hypothetical protein
MDPAVVVVLLLFHYNSCVYRVTHNPASATPAALAFHTTSSLLQQVCTCNCACLQVWDLQAGQMLYQSSILGASVPTCLAVDAAAARLAMGCADGSVRQFDLAQLPACREMQVSYTAYRLLE